jgi:hypothetical protein
MYTDAPKDTEPKTLLAGFSFVMKAPAQPMNIKMAVAMNSAAPPMSQLLLQETHVMMDRLETEAITEHSTKVGPNIPCFSFTAT